MLDLEFSPEQEMLRETVRKVCATYSPLSVVRDLEDDPVGYSPELPNLLGDTSVRADVAGGYMRHFAVNRPAGVVRGQRVRQRRDDHRHVGGTGVRGG